MICGKKIVSLCISRIHDIENFRFIKGLGQKLSENGMSLFIYDITADLYWQEDVVQAETSVFQLVDFSVTDILVIMYEKIKSKKIADDLVRRAKEHNVPVIMVDSVYEGCCSICVDYKGAFEKIVRHVVEVHGVKNPHLLAGLRDNIFSDERIEAFRKVIEDNGIPFTEDRVSYGDFWAVPARNAMEKLLESGNIPDAVICANDIMAINAFTVFKEHGYKVPEDVIITGFDGIDEINFSKPKITSVSCGTSCFTDMVFDEICIIAKHGFSPKKLYVRPDLLINGSCGCCDSPDESEADVMKRFNDRFYRFQDDNMTLAQMTGKMLSAKEIWEIASLMFNDVIKNTICLINKECTNHSTDYFGTSHGFSDEMFLIFDNINPRFVLQPFRRDQLMPGLENAVATGYPIIFNSVSFMEVPVGYLCFCFPEYNMVDYTKIPQIVNYLGYGIGGYINMCYQHYLNERISHIYQLDQLTELYTRRAFMEEFNKCRKTRNGMAMTVILADLDGLKHINDNFGHAEGDSAIKAVANALACSCPPDSLTVRLGGDEMLAIIFGEYNPLMVKQNIVRYLEEYNSSHSLDYIVSASVGYYLSVMGDETDFEELVRSADLSLYKEKIAKKRHI